MAVSESRKNLIIHLGYHKTGTTSIQKWLMAHAPILDPYLKCFNLEDGSTDALKLATNHFVLGKSGTANIRERAQALAGQIGATGQDTVCITDEGLPGLPLAWSNDEFEETRVYPYAPEIIEILAEEFSEFSPHFVVFERESSAWLRSIHNQMTRQKRARDSFDAFLARANVALDWALLRGRLRKAIGAHGKLTAYTFETEFDQLRVRDMGLFQLFKLPDEVWDKCQPKLPAVNVSTHAPVAHGTEAPTRQDAPVRREGVFDATDIEHAFRLFLGRKPRPGLVEEFPRFDKLIDALLRSGEFRQSPLSRKNPDTKWPETQYFIAPERKILYCPIGKNACTFLKRAMVRIADHPHQQVILRSVHLLTDQVRSGMQLSDYETPQIENFLQDPDIYSFALLRNPERRLLSAYIEKFVKNRTNFANVTYHTGPVVRAAQTARGLTEPDYDAGISFREFIEHIVSRPPKRLDAHWRPQHLYLGNRSWTRLFRFEDIGKLMHELEQRTGMTLEEPPVNQSGSGVGTDTPGADTLLPPELDRRNMISARSFLADDLREKIHNFFRKDYKLLEGLD